MATSKQAIGESMALHVLDKTNSRPRFLYRQKIFLNKPNAMIQLFFDHACSAWDPNLRKDMQKIFWFLKIIA